MDPTDLAMRFSDFQYILHKSDKRTQRLQLYHLYVFQYVVKRLEQCWMWGYIKRNIFFLFYYNSKHVQNTPIQRLLVSTTLIIWASFESLHFVILIAIPQ